MTAVSAPVIAARARARADARVGRGETRRAGRAGRAGRRVERATARDRETMVDGDARARE